MVFLCIELSLRNINRYRLVTEFKKSKELKTCDKITRSILLKVIKTHNFKTKHDPHIERYYQSASVFEGECSRVTNDQSLFNSSDKVKNCGKKIFKVLEDFEKRQKIVPQIIKKLDPQKFTTINEFDLNIKFYKRVIQSLEKHKRDFIKKNIKQ